MNKDLIQEKIDKMEKVIEYDSCAKCHGIMDYFKQALKQSEEETIERVEKILKKIEGKNKPECDCDCRGPICNSLMHQCYKPEKHTPQNEFMYVKFKKKVLKDVLAELKEKDE